jgi:rRNA maturation protein Nop10
MKKRQVRCYRGWAEAAGRCNIEVFYALSDGYRIELFTCTECGEIFVVDFENPDFHGRTILDIAMAKVCPRCGGKLNETLKPYPGTFRTEDGMTGHFTPSPIIPSPSESTVREFFEIE